MASKGIPDRILHDATAAANKIVDDTSSLLETAGKELRVNEQQDQARKGYSLTHTLDSAEGIKQKIFRYFGLPLLLQADPWFILNFPTDIRILLTTHLYHSMEETPTGFTVKDVDWGRLGFQLYHLHTASLMIEQKLGAVGEHNYQRYSQLAELFHQYRTMSDLKLRLQKEILGKRNAIPSGPTVKNISAAARFFDDAEMRYYLAEKIESDLGHTRTNHSYTMFLLEANAGKALLNLLRLNQYQELRRDRIFKSRTAAGEFSQEQYDAVEKFLKTCDGLSAQSPQEHFEEMTEGIRQTTTETQFMLGSRRNGLDYLRDLRILLAQLDKMLAGIYNKNAKNVNDSQLQEIYNSPELFHYYSSFLYTLGNIIGKAHLLTIAGIADPHDEYETTTEIVLNYIATCIQNGTQSQRVQAMKGNRVATAFPLESFGQILSKLAIKLTLEQKKVLRAQHDDLMEPDAITRAQSFVHEHYPWVDMGYFSTSVEAHAATQAVSLVTIVMWEDSLNMRTMAEDIAVHRLFRIAIEPYAPFVGTFRKNALILAAEGVDADPFYRGKGEEYDLQEQEDEDDSDDEEEDERPQKRGGKKKKKLAENSLIPPWLEKIDYLERMVDKLGKQMSTMVTRQEMNTALLKQEMLFATLMSEKLKEQQSDIEKRINFHEIHGVLRSLSSYDEQDAAEEMLLDQSMMSNVVDEVFEPEAATEEVHVELAPIAEDPVAEAVVEDESPLPAEVVAKEKGHKDVKEVPNQSANDELNNVHLRKLEDGDFVHYEEDIHDPEFKHLSLKKVDVVEKIFSPAGAETLDEVVNEKGIVTEIKPFHDRLSFFEAKSHGKDGKTDGHHGTEENHSESVAVSHSTHTTPVRTPSEEAPAFTKVHLKKVEQSPVPVALDIATAGSELDDPTKHEQVNEKGVVVSVTSFNDRQKYFETKTKDKKNSSNSNASSDSEQHVSKQSKAPTTIAPTSPVSDLEQQKTSTPLPTHVADGIASTPKPAASATNSPATAPATKVAKLNTGESFLNVKLKKSASHDTQQEEKQSKTPALVPEAPAPVAVNEAPTAVPTPTPAPAEVEEVQEKSQLERIKEVENKQKAQESKFTDDEVVTNDGVVVDVKPFKARWSFFETKTKDEKPSKGKGKTSS